MKKVLIIALIAISFFTISCDCNRNDKNCYNGYCYGNGGIKEISGIVKEVQINDKSETTITFNDGRIITFHTPTDQIFQKGKLNVIKYVDIGDKTVNLVCCLKVLEVNTYETVNKDKEKNKS